MNPADIHARPLPRNVHAVVIEQANAWYVGKVSSVEAYRAIDQVALSAFNWFPGILDRTREEFDRQVARRIDADVDGWSANDDTTPTTRF